MAFYVVNLDAKARKRYFQMVSAENFRKFISKRKIQTKAFITRFKKNYDRITSKELQDYLEGHYLKSDDLIVELYENAVSEAVSKEFPRYTELARKLEKTPYSELNEDAKKELESYRSEYEQAHFKMSFDDLIQASCAVNENEVIKQNNEKMSQQLKETQDELAKAVKTAESLSAENESLRKQCNRLENDNKKTLETSGQKYDQLHQQFTAYKQQFAVDSVSSSLSEVLGHELTGSTYESIYAELSDLEHSSLEQGDYMKTQLVLAAKYAVVKVWKQVK